MEVLEVIVYFVLKIWSYACWEIYALDHHYLIIMSLSNLWQL